MAPRLRSASRNTSRNTSRNPSRPTTPMEASRPTSSASETARPRKQRRTGPETRVSVDVAEEPERQRERKKATSSMETVQEQPETSEQPEQATSSTQTVVPEQQQPIQPEQSVKQEQQPAQPVMQQQPQQPEQIPAQQAAPAPPPTAETARPRRQRNAGRQTRAPADIAEPSTRQTGRKRTARQMQSAEEHPEEPSPKRQSLPLPDQSQAQSQPQPKSEPQQADTPEQSQEQPVQAEVPRLDSETWVEPPLRVPAPTYREQGLEKGAVLTTMQPLGTLPSARILRQVGLAPPLTPPARQAAKRKGGAKSKKPAPAAENGAVEQPQAASTSAEDVIQSDSSQAEAIIRDVLAREEQLVRVTRSKSGKEIADGESAPADGQSAGSPAPDTRFSAVKFDQVIEAAIARAHGKKNHGVEGGLRLIKEEASSDPFVQSVVETAFANPATPESRAAFQSLIRDAVARFQAEEEAKAAHAAASTRSATTSSLSSAKSLDAATFAPVASEEADSAQAPTEGKAAQAAASKGKGKGRVDSVEARASPQPDSAFERKRKRAEDPEFSEEAIAAKRRALEAALVTDNGKVEESNLRTQVLPPAGHVWPARWIVPSDDEEPAKQPAGVSTGRKARAPPKPAAVATSSKRVRKPVIAQPEEIDNIDFCRACNGSGQLLCCDGCVDSFHFTCLDPPMDPNSPPEGQWYCPSCAKKGLLGGLAEAMDSIPQTNFQLPEAVRGFFTGVTTGDKGEYTEVTELPEGSGRGRTTRQGRAEELDPLRVRDSKGNVVVCVRCRTTSEGRRPIIQCDYCPCWWHLDCLDPPPASCPRQKPGSEHPGHYWKCPNHVEHELANIRQPGRVRRPRNPKFVDIEVFPDSDGESVGEHEKEGTVYRVRERGVILDFITQVKRGHAEREAEAAEAARLAQEQADAEATSAFSGLLPTEQNAVMGLLNIAGQSPVERAGHVVSQLIADAPSGAFGDATSEIEILRSLQEVVSRRIQALNSASAATN